MSIHLNHTIVPARDKNVSAQFWAEIFHFEPAPPFGPFAPLRVDETLTLDFDDRGNTQQHLDWHHYAFQVSEEEFDAIFDRVKTAGISYGSGPRSLDDGQINHRNGGRGVYFKDPNGHVLELLTRE
jgi:catechol 2,3-dioxygenase-like lactoylglutathione lyase family enzyme